MQQLTALAALGNVVQAANRVILGKDKAIKLALACLLARGHLDK